LDASEKCSDTPPDKEPVTTGRRKGMASFTAYPKGPTDTKRFQEGAGHYYFSKTWRDK
jgi:hypothetical protein